MRFAATVEARMSPGLALRSTNSDSTTADSCTSKVEEIDMCETVDVDPALATPRRPIGSGSSARKSKLGRFRQGRQRDRRALQAETEKDLELIRRFEVEVDATRGRQRTRELQLRDVLRLGTSTTVDEIAGTRTLGCPPHVYGDKGSPVCFAAAAVKTWDNGDRIDDHPAHLHVGKGSSVCLATAALKARDVNHEGSTRVSDEWPVLCRPTGSTPISSYPSHEAASVGIGQSSADDGTALVEVHDEHANRAPHLKPKSIDEASSFVDRFGIEKSQYDLDILYGNRSADGRPMVKVSGYGKYTAADAVDFAAGRPYVRRPAKQN